MKKNFVSGIGGFLLGAAALLGFGFPSMVNQQPPPATQVVPASASVAAQSLLAAHNAERSRAGLKPLKMNPILMASAQSHADQMARKGKMAHDGIGDGNVGQRVTSAGYRWSWVAENVAWGQRDVATVMKDWMGSAGHRANILGWGVEVGFGVANLQSGQPYWCSVFANP